MRYLIIDKKKLNLWAFERIIDLEDMGFIDDEESLAKFKEIYKEGFNLGKYRYCEFGMLKKEDVKFWDELEKEL